MNENDKAREHDLVKRRIDLATCRIVPRYVAVTCGIVCALVVSGFVSCHFIERSIPPTACQRCLESVDAYAVTETAGIQRLEQCVEICRDR